MSNSSLSFPRETVEFLPLDVSDAGQPVTGYDTALLPYKQRPTTWAPAAVVDGKHGLMINGLAPGRYGIWVRVVANLESVVIGPGDPAGAGYITIT